MARTADDIKVDLIEILDATPEDQKKQVEEDIRGELYAAQTMRRAYVGKSASAAKIKELVQEAVDMRDEGEDEEAVDYLVDMFMTEEELRGDDKEKLDGGRKKRASKKTRKTKKAKKTKKTRKTRATRRR